MMESAAKHINDLPDALLQECFSTLDLFTR